MKTSDLQKHLYNQSMDLAKNLLTSRYAYDSNNRAQYLGLAAAGSAEGDAVWQIRQITYDGNGNPTGILFANGQPDFVFAWSGRAAISYA